MTQPNLDKLDESLQRRFWDKVDKRKKSECWPWTAALTTSGYGVLGLTGRGSGNVRATHVSWMIHQGTPVKKGFFICHKCDNPICVNPQHLFMGTPRDNARDSVKKGRNSPPPIMHGSENPFSKLTEKHIRRIRKLKKLGVSIHELALIADVSKTTIKRILNGTGWKHI